MRVQRGAHALELAGHVVRVALRIRHGALRDGRVLLQSVEHGGLGRPEEDREGERVIQVER